MILNKKEQKKCASVIQDICNIDNAMAEVVKITKKRQVIIYHGEYRFQFLSTIAQFFNTQGTPARTLINCCSVYGANCTIRIYRSPESIKNCN